MTLSEFKSKFFARPSVAPPSTLYVFSTEDSADAWIECMYFGSNNHSYELTMVLRSDMTAEYTLKKEWCEAEVEQFYAVEPDVICVVAKRKRGGEK